MSKERIRQVRRRQFTGAGLCPCCLAGSWVSEVPVPGHREQGRAANCGVQGTRGRLGPSGPAHRGRRGRRPSGRPCPGGSEDRACSLRAHPVRPVPLPLPGSQLPASSSSPVQRARVTSRRSALELRLWGASQASPGDGKGGGRRQKRDHDTQSNRPSGDRWLEARVCVP